MLNSLGVRERISITNPQKINRNSMYLVDLGSLKHAEDLLCDDLGAWAQSETSKKHYFVEKDARGKCIKIDRITPKEGTLTVVRRPFKNKSDDTVRKVMVNIINPDGSHFPLVYVHYYFIGPEHDVVVKPHLNSKTSIPYLRTFKSTRVALENELTNNQVKKSLFKVTESVGGVEEATCGGALPRIHKEEER